MSRFGELFNVAFFTFFSYNTVRQARFYSLKIGVLFRLFQLAIIGYIIGWNIVAKKGYQQFDTVSSTVTSKVKGLGYINFSNSTSDVKLLNGHFMIKSENGLRMFDTADYVVPPSEFNSIFVMTNFIETKQSQGVCDEELKHGKCKSDADCSLDSFKNNWNGLPTGKCISSSIDPNNTVCEISSWCPVERDPTDKNANIIQNIENFTIFIKNDIKFAKFNKHERNILPDITNDFIANCAYQSNRNPLCPVFRIKEILEMSEPNEIERQQMLSKGAVIQIEIQWNCNYDTLRKNCMPVYKFSRFDLPFNKTSSASGFNFRFAEKFEVNGTVYRILVKAYGLRFIINVTGNAGKFNIVPLLISVGSGIGLLSVATIVVDCFLLNLAKKRNLYKEVKRLEYKKELGKEIQLN